MVVATGSKLRRLERLSSGLGKSCMLKQQLPKGNRSKIFASLAQKGDNWKLKTLKCICVCIIFPRWLTFAIVHIRLIAFTVLCTGSIRKLRPRNLKNNSWYTDHITYWHMFSQESGKKRQISIVCYLFMQFMPCLTPQRIWDGFIARTSLTKSLFTFGLVLEKPGKHHEASQLDS